MRISDWSSDVFSSDLADRLPTEDIADVDPGRLARQRPGQRQVRGVENAGGDRLAGPAGDPGHADLGHVARSSMPTLRKRHMLERLALASRRSEEHTSELQSLMRISYAVFCLKKKNITNNQNTYHQHEQ